MEPERPATTSARGLGYLAGLDGLRGVAVSAVFLFHAGVLDGGFLGVDVFFVISGFLITALAIGEVERTGRLRLGAFWARRARRLLPAMFALCGAAVLHAALLPQSPNRLGREVISTLAYLANWARLEGGYEYFAAYSEPSLLEHTWSLAVEEQFYVVWPLVVVGAAWCAARAGWSLRVVIGITAVGAGIASVVMSWWLLSGPSPSLNRLYLGTDTRAVGLAVGCVLGCVLGRGHVTAKRRVGSTETVGALAGLALLAALMLSADGSEEWLYRYGFGMSALASVAVVAAVSGDGSLGRLFGISPLARLGRVSYGVYLWHWPVIVVLDTEATGLSGLSIGALWILVTALLTIASWVLIERPAPLPTVRHPNRVLTYGAVCLAIGAAGLVVPRLVTVSSEPVVAPVQLDARAEQAPDADVEPIATAAEAGPSTESPVVDGSSTTTSDDARDDARSAEPVVPNDRPLRMLIIGDSIAESLGASPEPVLRVDGIDVATTNRSIIACPVTWIGQWAFDDGRLIADPPACDGEDRFEQFVAETDPDLVLFMFGWPGTIAGRELPDGTVVDPCEAAFDEQFADELAKLVVRLGAGRTSVVATVAPPTEYRNPAQSDRPECLNRVIRAGDYPVYEFGEWLCPSRDCTAAEPLLRDTIHFAGTPEVQMVIWPAILSDVLDAAGYRT